jgi:hypothetical protein
MTKKCIACHRRKRVTDRQTGDEYQYCWGCLGIRRAQMEKAGYLQRVPPRYSRSTP